MSRAEVMVFFDDEQGWWFRMGNYESPYFDTHAEAMAELNRRYHTKPRIGARRDER